MPLGSASQLCPPAREGNKKHAKASDKQATSKQQASNKQATSKQQASNKQATSKQQASNKQATSKQKTSNKQANAITLKTRALRIEPTQPRSQVRIPGRWAAQDDATITARLCVPSAVVSLWRVGGIPPSARLSPRMLSQDGNHKNKYFPATTETMKKPTTETIKKRSLPLRKP